MVELDDVTALAMRLPEVAEGETRRGNPEWEVGGKAFAWVRAFSKADIRRFGDEEPPAGPILAVHVEDLSEKEAFLQAGHEGIFTIPHFDGYAAILIQLDAVAPDALEEALEAGWLACAPTPLAEAYVTRDEPPDE